MVYVSLAIITVSEMVSLTMMTVSEMVSLTMMTVSEIVSLTMMTVSEMVASLTMMTVSEMGEQSYHDDGERNGEPRDAAKERRGADERERAGVDPLPELVRRHAAVQVHQRLADHAPVQTADKPVCDINVWVVRTCRSCKCVRRQPPGTCSACEHRAVLSCKCYTCIMNRFC